MALWVVENRALSIHRASNSDLRPQVHIVHTANSCEIIEEGKWYLH